MHGLACYFVCWSNVASSLGFVLLVLFYTNNFVHYHVKTLFCYLMFAFCASSVIPMILFNLPHVKYSAVSIWTRATSELASLLYGITCQTRGLEIMPREKGCVIVSNHQSVFDVIFFMGHFVEIGRWVALVKKALFYVWPMGLAMWMVGNIFIDRSNPEKAKKQLAHITKLINKDNIKIIFFVEGTRNRKGTSLLPFKKGAFFTAIDSQAPIIPIVYSPYHFIDQEKLVYGSGQVIMQVLPPIPTQGLTIADMDDLMERTRSVMQTCFTQLTREVETDKKKQ